MLLEPGTKIKVTKIAGDPKFPYESKDTGTLIYHKSHETFDILVVDMGREFPTYVQCPPDEYEVL